MSLVIPNFPWRDRPRDDRLPTTTPEHMSMVDVKALVCNWINEELQDRYVGETICGSTIYKIEEEIDRIITILEEKGYDISLIKNHQVVVNPCDPNNLLIQFGEKNE